jgi:outer membrane receptor protein involved in Fe transport
MATEQKAWFKPLYDITLAANYRLEEKFNFKLNVFYIGQQFGKRVYPNSNFTGLIPDNFDVYKIKSWVDLNLGANYQYNKRLGAFVSVNNILGTRYQRWLDYPTQSFNFLIGATLSF